MPKRFKKRRSRKNKKTIKKLSQRVSILETDKEKKYDIFLLSNPSTPNVPNSQEMTNDLGTYTSGFTLQIADCNPIISQGTNDNERIGDQVELRNINHKCVITYEPNADLPATGKIGKGDIAHCRVLLVWDHVPTFTGTNHATGVPTLQENHLEWSHVLGVNPSQTQTPLVCLAPIAQDLVVRGKRISVLYDKMFDMVAGTDKSTYRINFNRSWVRKKLKYLMGSSKSMNNRLKLLYVSNRVSLEAPHIYCSQKTQYTDS